MHTSRETVSPGLLFRILRPVLKATIVLLVVGVGLLLLVRWQWDRNLERTLSWYQERVGAIDYQAYSPKPIADEENLASLLVAAATGWPEVVDRTDLSEFTQRYYDLPTPGAEPEPISEVELESTTRARAALDRLQAVLEHVDRMAGRVESRLGLSPPWEADSNPEWLLRAIALSDAQMGRAALALEQSDCAEAASHAVGLERIAAALRREPLRVLHILGNRLESDFNEVAQTVLERDLVGGCTTPAGLVRQKLSRAQQHLDEIRLPFSRLMAAEGSLITSWEIAPAGLVERLAGRNGGNFFASHLAFYGEIAQKARVEESMIDGPPGEEIVPPPRLPIPARWASNDKIIADMMRPMVASEFDKEQRLRDSRALTDYLMRLSDCRERMDCEPPSLPESPTGGETLRVEPSSPGQTRLWFPIPDDSIVNAVREQEYSSCEVPTELLPEV